MDVVSKILEKSYKDAENFKPIHVTKLLELDYDIGRLLASDPNDLDHRLISSRKNQYLEDLTRDNVQLLINKIWELPTEHVEEVIVAKLPKAKFPLPRARRIPKPRPLTKFQAFAFEKGIQKKKKSKLNWDAQLQKWIPTYGYKRAAAEKEKDWVLEVPQSADPYEDQFEKKAMIKSEKVAKNELQRLRNIAKAKNVKVPRSGLLAPDVSSSKDLQKAVTVAKASTASVGKFQNKLSKEKEAKDVHTLIPGGKRKRKLPPVSGKQEQSENLEIVDRILNKKPKIDIGKAVDRQISQEQSQRAQEKQNERPKAGRMGKKKKGGGIKSKKPKGSKGARKGVGSAGRKRR